MTVRENSLEAYRELKGHLSDRAVLIYEFIEKKGISTERQIKNGLELDDMNAVRPRVTELIQAGLLVEGEKVIDKKTSRHVRTVLIEGQCAHNRYRQNDYMMVENAKKAMKAGKICWMGIVVTDCEICGADISHAKRVQVMTGEQYIKNMGISHK